MYVMALLPVIFGGAMWLFKKSITWWEWVIGVALAFAVSGIVHIAVVQGMISDTETWSGWVVSATYHPYWHEYYTTTHYTHDSKGNITGSYTVAHHIDHPKHWTCDDNLGGYHRITQEFHGTLKTAFGGAVAKVRGSRPNFQRGDRHNYMTARATDYIEPVNIAKSFENRIKAAPSVFSYAKVPKDAGVFEYPYAKDWNQSKRLLGNSNKDIGVRQWDQMNARLGPTKKVNVIICAFKETSINGQYQEAAWIGGKKNDLVICYGWTNGEHATWAYVFGWTEQEIVKRNLESILLENPVDTTIIPLIEKEIIANYEIKDWSKFDYIALDPPGWCFIMLFFIMLITQGGFYYWAHMNEFHGLSIES